MHKSPNDPKSYQAVTLQNGLRVLLIENNETNKSAAALAVNAGHFNDPKQRQGLAHFIEHMLFLGTEKYPDGSEYQKFISQHGGTNNAWTATEHTSFFFDIQHQYFAEALERFGQFFTAPLLSESFINKERQNIDAEFKLKLKDEIRRLYDVHKETINPDHPFSKFSVGNIDTLADRDGTSIRNELLAFYHKYYRANYMTLALEGPHSLSELKALAEKNFGAIKSTKQPMELITAPLYLPENQGVYLNVCPVKNDRQLILSFAMPSIDKFYQEKPETVLIYLMGHEGQGSILSLLKRNQWALGLTAGSGINGSNFKDYNVSIALTEEGEAHIDEIITIVFSYINLLKKKPIPEFYYQEKQAIAELSFNFQEKSKPIDSVSQLVINMQHYPEAHYITGDYIMTGVNQKNINLLLSYFTPQNMRVIHISQIINTNVTDNNLSKKAVLTDELLKEKVNFECTSCWYEVPYRIEKINPEKHKAWQNPQPYDALYLPSENPYIIGNPEIYSHQSPTEIPVLQEKIDGLNIWYKQDATFKVPKGYIYISLDAPYSIESVENIAMTRLLVDMYGDTLIEENYDAELAGIHYHLFAHQGGVTLQISGISEKQGALLNKLLTSLKGHELEEGHFCLLKEQLLNHWKNTDTNKSISQLFSTLSTMMQPYSPSSDELHSALKQVTFEHFVEFSQRVFNEITMDVLIHGNWLPHHVEVISSTIKTTFEGLYSAKNKIKYPILDIKNQGDLLVPLTLPEHDHACVVYYPQEAKDNNTIAKVIITSHLLSPLFFQEMRTEKQFGYLVGVGYIPLNKYPGIAFYIQSPSTQPTELINAIDDFINRSDVIDNMTPEEWHQLQKGLSSQLQEKDTSLRIKSQRFWAAICNDDVEFNHKESLVKAIQSITPEQIKNFIREFLSTTSHPDRVLLLSNTVSKTADDSQSFKSDKSNIINNIKDFSKNCQRKF